MSSPCLLLTVLVAAGLLAFIQGCSPPMRDDEPTMAEHVYFSDVVFAGKVLRTFQDNNFPTSTAYTAEMEVYCVYKGGDHPKVVNISEAGAIPGMCHSTDLKVNHQYILLLRTKDDGSLVPTNSQLNMTTDKLHEVSEVCGLELLHPAGVSLGDFSPSCPNPAVEGHCSNFQPPPMPATEESDHEHMVPETTHATDHHGQDSHTQEAAVVAQTEKPKGAGVTQEVSFVMLWATVFLTIMYK